MTRHTPASVCRRFPFRLGILGRQDNRFVRDLQRAARELDVESTILEFSLLKTSLLPLPSQQIQPCSHAGLGPGGLRQSVELSACGVSASDSNQDNYNAILVRSMPLGSLEQVIFRMDVLHVWQAQGCAILNSPRCLEASIDKWLTLHRLHLAGVNVPPTVSCQDRHQAMAAFDLLGRDVLVKPLFGGEGRGIIRLQNRDLAWRTFSTLQQLGQVLYLQMFVPNFGYDVRVLVVGNEMWSIRRRAMQGEFRTNVSQGGKAEPHLLTEAQREMAVSCASAVGGAVVGVDILPALNGQCYALEVNAVPGWKALAECLNIDVANRIVRFAMQKAVHAQACAETSSSGAN